jgi:hypothetical protein
MKSCKLDDALGLRVRRLAEVPVDAQLSAERRVFLRGATLAGVQPGLAIPDQQLRKRSQRREDQRASTGARVVPTPDCARVAEGRIRTLVDGSKPALRPVNVLWAVPAELIGREEERASIGGFLERSEHAPTALVLSGELRRRSSTSPRAPASSPKAEPAPAA